MTHSASAQPTPYAAPVSAHRDSAGDAVVLENVRKKFGDFVAVNDISLRVPRGSIYGFLGPNGAGKTTTIRMMMSIFYPDAGRISILGEPNSELIKDRLGYLPEEKGLYKDMKTGELVSYFGRLKGMTRKDARAKAVALLQRFELGDWIEAKCKALSKGMGQKVQILATLLHDPELVILDEPFSGLDPVNRDVLRDAVLEIKRRGTTIVFSTHDMSMAELMCDRILMIFRGRKVLDGSLDEIQATYGHDGVQVRVQGGSDVLREIEGVQAVTDHGNVQQVRLSIDPQVFLARLAARTSVQRFEITRPSLHDIFIEIAGPSAREDSTPVA